MYAKLPIFSQIQTGEIENTLDDLLDNNLQTIDTLLIANVTYTWDNLLQPIENLTDRLHQFWSPIQHLSAVIDSPVWREVMKVCVPKISDYHTHILHNEKLFHAIESIYHSDAFKTYDVAKQKSIENELRDFKLGGVHLSLEKKERFAQLLKSLSQLAHQFEENVLDATMHWKKHITDETLLAGIPNHAKNAAKKHADNEGKTGWVFTLDAPDYLAVMTYADLAALREEMYHAFITRASDTGPNAGKFDNTRVMQRILEQRFELAKLLGYNNFAEYSLATKMVKKTDEVLAFLNELAEKTMNSARAEFHTLSQFAHTELSIEQLNAWDIAYACEKLRQKEYAISQEDLRPYFPEQQVTQGLFDIMHRLYDITVEKIKDADVWHPDVTCFRIKDVHGQLQAHLYFDLYARKNKRGGAWMDECCMRRRLDDGQIQLPAAYVTCNFNAPIDDHPALFTHADVETLFHECGHALQQVLTKIDVASVSGIHGIPWDAVEIASQFFENWAWNETSIHYFAKHYQTKLQLPSHLYERMHRAKNFQSAMQMARQLELALFDFILHMTFTADEKDGIQTILNRVREHIAVFPVPQFNRFQHGFSHIFSGGYAAGYYSYKWAEVMACDAFSVFEEKGIFDKHSSELFKTTFLESGGAKEPMDLFIAFRGRKPTVDALLKQSEIV